MKYFILFLTMTYLILALGCKIQRNTALKSNDLCCKDTIVIPSMYLSNRIPDCGKSIRYMDSVIHAKSLYVDARKNVPNIVEGRFSIICDSINLYRKNTHLFYINKACFIGKPFADFYQVFCPDNDLEILKKLESASFKKETGFRLYLFSNSDFDMIVEIQKGYVETIEFSQKHLIENK